MASGTNTNKVRTAERTMAETEDVGKSGRYFSNKSSKCDESGYLPIWLKAYQNRFHGIWRLIAVLDFCAQSAASCSADDREIFASSRILIGFRVLKLVRWFEFDGNRPRGFSNWKRSSSLVDHRRWWSIVCGLTLDSSLHLHSDIDRAVHKLANYYFQFDSHLCTRWYFCAQNIHRRLDCN